MNKSNFSADHKSQFKNIYSNTYAYAAIDNNNNIITGGRSEFGGDSSKVQAQLKNIKDIYSTNLHLQLLIKMVML